MVSASFVKTSFILHRTEKTYAHGDTVHFGHVLSGFRSALPDTCGKSLIFVRETSLGTHTLNPQQRCSTSKLSNRDPHSLFRKLLHVPISISLSMPPSAHTYTVYIYNRELAYLYIYIYVWARVNKLVNVFQLLRHFAKASTLCPPSS